MSQDDRTKLIDVRVSKRTVEAVDICSYELVDIGGAPLPAFSAGAHVDVHGPTGIVRQYSLCSPENDTSRYQIAVLKDPASRGGSVAMHEGVAEGNMLKISLPRNHFSLDAHATHSILVAGGIGVTPIMSMVESLARAGASFELHYCCRTLEKTAFWPYLNGFAEKGSVHLHLDQGPAEQRANFDAIFGAAPAGSHLFMCGPQGFLNHVGDAAKRAGWESERIHFELFAAAVDADAQGDAFTVKVASTGKTYLIPGVTLAESTALAQQGVEIPVSCEQGICGSCLTGVLEGTPDHRDQYLTAQEHKENKLMTPCCSRARSSCLVLDI